MKKIIVGILFLFGYILMLPISAQYIAIASDSEKPIQVIPILNGSEMGTASLYGDGVTFITNIKVTVHFENFAPYEITLEDGYSPFIETFDFGANDKFLFCASQTGGSGGYGNYRVYRLGTSSYQLMYDDKTDSKNATFGAVFQANGFMKLTNDNTQNTLDVYVGYMDPLFYNLIFASDGSVIGEQPYVNDISFVSPALNSSTGIWRLITYRSVAAVAEVNRLGYIVQTLDFDGNNFYPTFTEFAINL